MKNNYILKSHYIGINPFDSNDRLFNIAIELQDKKGSHLLNCVNFTFKRNELIEVESELVESICNKTEVYIYNNINDLVCNEIESDLNEYLEYAFTDKTHNDHSYTYNHDKKHYIFIKVFQCDFNDDDLLKEITDKHGLTN